MNFNEYQDFISKFAKYPETSLKESLSYCALGLTGESGEYAEKIKKYLRDGTIDPGQAALELGDVLWYLARSAHHIGYDLNTIAQMNIDKLSSRKERGVLGGSGDNR